jgi:hypothetical protein
MNIAIDINNFSIDNVYFGDSIKNAIIENGKFIRIFYSNDIMTLNGIYIKIDSDLKKLNDGDIQSLLSNITRIENNILEKINIPNKAKAIKISDYLIFNAYMNSNINVSVGNQNNFKYQNQYQYPYQHQLQPLLQPILQTQQTQNHSKIYNLNRMLLKISGVWETASEYGLTFKFIEINKM